MSVRRSSTSSIVLLVSLLTGAISCKDNPRSAEGIEGTGQTGKQSRDQGPLTADQVPPVLPAAIDADVGAPPDGGVGDGSVGDGGVADARRAAPGR